MLDTLRQAGRRLMAELSITPEDKATGRELGQGAGGDITHQADKEAERIILDTLRSTCEPLTVISEEAGILELNGGGRVVVVDPIDGSRNAITGLPVYCASIAVADGPMLKDVELAYIINLTDGTEFWARRGGGAFIEGTRLKTRHSGTMGVVAFEAHTPCDDLPRIMPLLCAAQKVRCLGSAAMALASLARGALSVFVEPSYSRSFDFAAGWLLVKEAGGVFTDIAGQPMGETGLGLGPTPGLLAAADMKTHRKALELLA